MSGMVIKEKREIIGNHFLTALVAQDFSQLQDLFGTQTRFRALVPRRICEGSSAGEATDWLRRWFGDADEIQVQQSAVEEVFDRLYIGYRLRLHDVLHGWRVIEQKMYGTVEDGKIIDLWLLCSGFRPEIFH